MRKEGKAVKEYPAVVGSSPEKEEEDSDEDDLARALEALEGRSSEPSDATSDDDFEWQSIYGQYKVKYLYLENKMEMLEGREAKWCTPPPAASERSKIGPEMDRYRNECQDVRGEKTALRAEMREMQADCLSEAKRFRVAPGDARLGR